MAGLITIVAARFLHLIRYTGADMAETQPARRYRFGVFEADSSTGELRKKGVRIKLHAQPFQLLFLLLDRPGETLTREEICRELWPDGTFVDYEHGVNSAVNRLREALGDKASNPRFVETLARRGYRFVAPVERILTDEEATTRVKGEIAEDQAGAFPEDALTTQPDGLLDRVLAGPEDLPAASHTLVRALFVLFQLMYLGFYVGALTNLGEIGDLLSPLEFATAIFLTIIVTSVLLIPVRTFLVCAVGFRAPRLWEKFRKLWPLLLPLDLLWALSPLLLLHHISYGLALACIPLLVYSPFAQRSLILMSEHC